MTICKKSSIKMNLLLFNASSHRFKGALHFLYKARITDMCYGFKPFKKVVINKLNLSSKDFSIETEITSKAIKYGLRIKEIPSMELKRRYEKSKFRNIIDDIKILITIIKNLN